MGSKAVFQLELKRLFFRAEFKFAFTVLLLITATAFVENCLRFAGWDLGALPSAAYGWPWNMDRLQVQSMRVLAFFLIFIIAASAFADNFLSDVKSGAAIGIVSRCPLKSYLMTNAVLSFLGGFLVIFVPLLISQLLAFLLFPAHGSFANHFNNPVYLYEGDKNLLFPSLVYNHPYLSNLSFALYASFWAGAASFLSFSLSLFIRRNRLISIGLPTAISLVSWQVAPILAHGSDAFTHFFYLYPYPSVNGLSLAYFIISPLIIFFAAAGLFAFARWSRKDILL